MKEKEHLADSLADIAHQLRTPLTSVTLILSLLENNPEFRKRGIGRRLILRTAECFKDGDILEVVTFREGDRKGIAARKCYHSCGFVDAEELVVFHYPCQKMKLKVKKGTE